MLMMSQQNSFIQGRSTKKGKNTDKAKSGKIMEKLLLGNSIMASI